MMQSSRALVLLGVVCMLIGPAASDEYAPPLSLYVPPAATNPQTMPKPQTMSVVPTSVMTPPDSPVVQPSFLMPQMSVGQPSMDTTPQFLVPAQPIAEAPSSPLAFLGGFGGGLLAGAALVYSLLSKTGQTVSVEAKNIELGASSGRAGLPAMMAATDEAGLNDIADNMSSDPVMARRALITGAGAALAAAPLAAFADGASSKAVLERARAIYGSRVARLVDASPEKIIEEKNTFTLFTTGAYRSAKDKEKQKELKALSAKALAAAKAGDKAGANAAVKEFVKAGEIRILDTVPGGNFDPKQRRNPGAPATAEVEAQMGSLKYALYRPLK